MEPSSRPAMHADAPAIARLVGMGREELAPTRGGELWSLLDARPEPPDGSIHEAITDEDQLLQVGLIDEIVLGYASVHLDALPDATLLAVIDEVYVEREARGVGVGHGLMGSILAWATELGCRGVDANVLPGNRAAKNFFESAGLVARAIVVHRPLTRSQVK